MEVIISNVENQHTKTESMTLGDSDISACWQRDCVASVAMTDHTARMAHGDSSKQHLVRENDHYWLLLMIMDLTNGLELCKYLYLDALC